MMTTGQLIKEARIKRGMKQQELAAKMGVSASLICTWEKGVKNPRRETIDRIAAALDVNPHNIYPEVKLDKPASRWRDAVGLYGSPTCSNCGSGAALKTRFCPHCGARMEVQYD